MPTAYCMLRQFSSGSNNDDAQPDVRNRCMSFRLSSENPSFFKIKIQLFD